MTCPCPDCEAQRREPDPCRECGRWPGETHRPWCRRMAEVCTDCGVEAGWASGLGRNVHLGELPRQVAEHDVPALVPLHVWQARQDALTNARAAVEELILHHASVHPIAGCEWAGRARDALRALPR